MGMEIEPCVSVRPPWNWIRPLIFSSLAIFAVNGNILVILAVALVRKLRKPKNYFLLSLAIADLLIGVIVVPFYTAQDVTCFDWSGWDRCLILIPISVDIFCCTASILGLTIITMDRYVAISHPLFYKVHATTCVTLSVILITWLLSLIIATPYWGMHQIYRALIGPQFVDKCIPRQWNWFHIILIIIFLFAPFLVMIATYVRICWILGTRYSNTQQVSGNVVQSGPVQKKSLKNIFKTLSQERKGWNMLGVVLSFFLICWLPYTVMIVWISVADALDTPVYPSHLTYEILRYLGYANSAINPFIYTMFDKNFRTALKNIVMCNWRKLNSSRSI